MSGGRLVRRLLVALLVAVFVVACLRLGWWQWQRFGLTGSAQNLGYTFQWPTIALFAVIMWWRLSKLEAQRRQQQAQDAKPATPPAPAHPVSAVATEPAGPTQGTGPAEPTSPAGRAEPTLRPAEPPSATGAGQTSPTRRAAREPTVPPDELDDELAAYNRYLAQLHAKESDRANRRAD